MSRKNNLTDLAIFGGDCLFTIPRSTSNLLRPDFEAFIGYSKSFFEVHQYTNNGPNVRLLEQRLAEFHEVEHCLTFCSGFWAIALAISALALEGKSEVVMPSLTYRRMADIAAWVKLKPHFCDVEPTTLAMSAETARSCVNNKTALILAAHPIVNCCEVAGLEALSKETGVPLLFDSVESVFESTARGRIGGFGNAEAFSLHACKLLNGFGGGYITTNSAKLANQLSLLRKFGFGDVDKIVIPGGMNAKLNEIHAAMALASLDGVEEQVERNRRRYQSYKQVLSIIPGVRLIEFDESHQVGYKNIVVELLDEWPLSREYTIDALNAENILARAYYSPALHRNPMMFDYVPAKLPVTDRLAECHLNLPCGQHVSIDDITDIGKVLLFLSAKGGQIRKKLRQAKCDQK